MMAARSSTSPLAGRTCTDSASSRPSPASRSATDAAPSTGMPPVVWRQAPRARNSVVADVLPAGSAPWPSVRNSRSNRSSAVRAGPVGQGQLVCTFLDEALQDGPLCIMLERRVRRAEAEAGE
jgi:hypothetical protein